MTRITLALLLLSVGCGGSEPLNEPCRRAAECPDGFACVGTIGKPGNVCRPMCHTDADCGGSACKPLIGIDDFGFCDITS